MSDRALWTVAAMAAAMRASRAGPLPAAVRGLSIDSRKSPADRPPDSSRPPKAASRQLRAWTRAEPIRSSQAWPARW